MLNLDSGKKIMLWVNVSQVHLEFRSKDCRLSSGFAKTYKAKWQNWLAMKINNLIVGVIVVALAALLLADGIISYVDPTNQMFSLNDIKGIVGVILIVLGASYLKAAKE
jgi:hypothetical protein